MENQRLEILQQMVARKPNDSFARYGLAMEYAGRDEYDLALENFHTLLNVNPDYAAAYYQAGQIFIKTGQTEQAKSIFRKGIEVTSRLGNQHAQSELEAALAQL